MCPSEGSLVVGPIDPATKRGRPGVENCAATSRATLQAARFNSRVRSSSPYSASTMRVEPNVSVSTTSQPTPKNAA